VNAQTGEKELNLFGLITVCLFLFLAAMSGTGCKIRKNCPTAHVEKLATKAGVAKKFKGLFWRPSASRLANQPTTRTNKKMPSQHCNAV
jgi:hypothetical protein